MKQAGQGFPYHPLLTAPGMHHRGMKHLAGRGGRTLDSNLVLTPVMQGFHYATQNHLEHTQAVRGKHAARLRYRPPPPPPAEASPSHGHTISVRCLQNSAGCLRQTEHASTSGRASPRFISSTPLMLTTCHLGETEAQSTWVSCPRSHSPSGGVSVSGLFTT